MPFKVTVNAKGQLRESRRDLQKGVIITSVFLQSEGVHLWKSGSRTESTMASCQPPGSSSLLCLRHTEYKIVTAARIAEKMRIHRQPEPELEPEFVY